MLSVWDFIENQFIFFFFESVAGSLRASSILVAGKKPSSKTIAEVIFQENDKFSTDSWSCYSNLRSKKMLSQPIHIQDQKVTTAWQANPRRLSMTVVAISKTPPVTLDPVQAFSWTWILKHEVDLLQTGAKEARSNHPLSVPQSRDRYLTGHGF